MPGPPGLGGHARVASFYGQPRTRWRHLVRRADYAWYRDGLVSNYREAVDIATQFSRLTSSSSQSAFDALFARWTARVKDSRSYKPDWTLAQQFALGVTRPTRAGSPRRCPRTGQLHGVLG